jgi:hypothetical protein
MESRKERIYRMIPGSRRITLAAGEPAFAWSTSLVHAGSTALDEERRNHG